MDKSDLIFQIKYLTSEIKINIEYSEIIIKYLQSLEEYKSLLLFNKNIDFLYIIAINSLSLAILSLNSLIEQKEDINGNEISPFNNKLELSENEITKLREIKKLFRDNDLVIYRNNTIAHKVFIDPKKTDNKYEVEADMKLLTKIKEVFNEFASWLIIVLPNTEDDNYIFEYLFNSRIESIANIIKLIEKEQSEPLMPLEDVASY